ncbi:hypothetical protein GHT06_012276 [Daphnia sinensis]|uniref:Uncharacterized protein n=1 Tax=Daphnia sinensis TaxID=1820382 RepID=A0AAD5LG20_9CRUS|nr:hypothetical protein GHT06_012276 [Daphnia sinensis]
MNRSLYLLCLVAVIALSVEAAGTDGARAKREPQVVNGGLVGALLGQRYGFRHYAGHLPSYHGHGSHGHHGHEHGHGHGHGHGFGFGGHHGGHYGGHGHHEHGHGHGHGYHHGHH